MKNLVLILAMLFIGSESIAQNYYFEAQQKKSQSFQVGLNSDVYNEQLLFGFQIGINFQESFDISMFLLRDYKSREESWMDSRWSGVNLNYMLNVNELVQLGPIVRFSLYNGNVQKPFIGLESRFRLNWNSKIGFFYGQGNSGSAGVKVIWNLY